MAFSNPEKSKILMDLAESGFLSPLSAMQIEKRFPFFDKTLVARVDYMTIRDLLELSGYEHDAPLFGALLCMFDALGQGSLCMSLDKKALAERLEVFSESKTAAEMAKSFASRLEDDGYDCLVSRNCDEYKPLVFVESGSRKLLYFQKYFVYENLLKNRIDRFLKRAESGTGKRIDGKKAHALIDRLFSPKLTLRIGAAGKPVIKDPFQVKAMELALGSSFCLVSGGPGTGKTSLMVNILRCFVRCGTAPEEIALCAPTGRAAQRMTEAIYSNIRTIRNPDDCDIAIKEGVKAATLHKTLRFRPRFNDFFYNERNPLPAALAVVDEATMVDVAMMEKFLRAIDSERTTVILLGDKDQLPSVDAGAVFAEMIPREGKSETFHDRLVVLKNTYRSEKRLQELAARINRGEWPDPQPVSLKTALAMEKDSWAMVATETAAKWKNDLILWAENRLLKSNGHAEEKKGETEQKSKGKDDGAAVEYDEETIGRASLKELTALASATAPSELSGRQGGKKFVLDALFEKTMACRILTLVKQGMYGAVEINRFLASHLMQRLKSRGGPREPLFSGATIIVTRNDYSKELFNGDMGVVIRDPEGTFRAYFKRSDFYVEYATDMLSSWELAYALTVHKCQGSEFDDVMVVLPDKEDHKLLTREMIYTAATRAKKRVVIYGKPTAFQKALDRKIVRESGLSWESREV